MANLFDQTTINGMTLRNPPRPFRHLGRDVRAGRPPNRKTDQLVSRLGAGWYRPDYFGIYLCTAGWEAVARKNGNLHG